MLSGFLTHRETLFRVLGVCLILTAAIGWGAAYNRRLRLRLLQLRQLRQLTALLRGEIEYQCAALPEAFIVCGGRVDSVCGAWLTEVGERLNQMEGIGFQEIWNEQTDLLRARSELGAETIGELRRLGSQLSYPDKETQLGALDLYGQRLKTEEERLTDELPGKRRLGTALSMLTGIFLILLLV